MQPLKEFLASLQGAEVQMIDGRVIVVMREDSVRELFQSAADALSGKYVQLDGLDLTSGQAI